MRSVQQLASPRISCTLSAVLFALLLTIVTRHAWAADGPQSASNESVEDLRKALQEEKERLRVLEERLAKQERQSTTSSESALTATQEKPKPTDSTPVSGSFGPDGFALKTADGANVLRLRGNVSVDGRYFTDSYTPAAADTWLVRRLRPTLEGTLDGRYDFRIMPDFGLGKSIVQDAWASVRIQPWLVLTAGKFKAPLGLERLQLEQFARFIEPSLTADLLPYRDLGFKVGGVFAGGLLNYDVGVFDGVLDAGSTDGNSVPDFDSTGKFTLAGRVFVKPFPSLASGFFKGLGVGVATSYVNDRGVATAATTTTLLANYKTTGQQPLFSYRGNTQIAGTFNNATIAQGIERRLVPQFSFYQGPVGLLGEYVRVDQQVQRQISVSGVRFATLRSDAWQVQAAVFLTGEAEGYDTATPLRSLGHGGFGAVEIVTRYHVIQFDDAAFEGGSSSFANPTTAARAAHAIGVGINWYLSRNVKTQLNYEITHFAGGTVTGNRPDERVLTSQFALIF